VSKYNWDKIPTEYNWVGVDSHGVIRAFSDRPVTACGYWIDATTGDTPSRLADLPYVVSANNWEDSLEKRPKPKPAKRYRLTFSEAVDLLNEKEY